MLKRNSTISTAESVVGRLGVAWRGPRTYRINSPFRPDSDSKSFVLTINDDEHGTFIDHASDESGSLYDLAQRLNIELPKPNTPPQTTKRRPTRPKPQPTSDSGAAKLAAVEHHPDAKRKPATPTKRAYTGLADYAEAHGVVADVFIRAKWKEDRHKGRLALGIPTENGTRWRYVDGHNPPFYSPQGYKRCWYGLERAAKMAVKAGPLVLCNGEPSVVVAQHFGIAACAMTSSGEATIPERLISELKEHYSPERGPVVVALDCDAKGQSSAVKLADQLSKLGYHALISDLGGTSGFDLADFCKEHQAQSALAFQRLVETAQPATPPNQASKDQVDDDEDLDTDDPISYRETPNGIFLVKSSTDGSDKQTSRRRLTNFTARIVRQIEIDDGENEPDLKLEIEAAYHERRRCFTVTADEFSQMTWPLKKLGAEARIVPGQTNRERTRDAIQLLSGRIPFHTVFRHLGWRKIDGKWAYLHAGGAIGADNISVDPETLHRYQLPEQPDKLGACNAVRASLDFLNLAPRTQTWPLLAAVYCSVLSDLLSVDFVMWLYGGTGARKSTIAALALNHFGSFDRTCLPANLTSSGNSLEGLAFTAKDVLFVVDDFAPPTEAKQASRQEAAVHQLIRAAGDRRGRGRMMRDTRQRAEKYPRGLVMITAELPPPGSQSTAARCFEVEWQPGTTNLERLTKAQLEHGTLYRQAMSGFVTWLASQYDDLSKKLPAWMRETQTIFYGDHGRIPEACAKLMAGVGLFLEYAVTVKAIREWERDRLIQEAATVLEICAAATNQAQLERKPTTIFLETLNTLFLQGKVYVCEKKEGGIPENPTQWGYQRITGRDEEYQPHPGGEKVGWISESEGMLYLMPEAVTRAIKRYCQGLDVHFALTSKALGDHLEREGFIVAKEGAGSRYQIRAEGKNVRTWVIHPFGEKLRENEKLSATSATLATSHRTISPITSYSVADICPLKTTSATSATKSVADVANVADVQNHNGYSINPLQTNKLRHDVADVADVADNFNPREHNSKKEREDVSPTPDGEGYLI